MLSSEMMSEDCEFTIETDAVSCGAIQMRIFQPGTWYTWTVNDVPADVPNGSSITYLIDGPGDYTFCATQNITECELCETVTVTEACTESCGDISWTLMNDVVPNPGLAEIQANFDGDLDDGMLIYHMGVSDTPYLSDDGYMGFQYEEGEYEVCVTFYGSNCSSTYCDTLVVGPAAVYGCTDPDAENYNPDADLDDGSCVYGPCELNIEILESCDTLRALASGNYNNQSSVWTINGEAAGYLLNWVEGEILLYASFLSEAGVPYEVCVESNHPACEDVVCETVVFGEDNCTEGCPMSQPSYTVAGCSLAVNLDSWNSGVPYTTVQVEGFEGTYTPSMPNNMDWYHVGSTIIFEFDEPGAHEICLGFSNDACTLQWYCYEVVLDDCDAEVIAGCTNPLALNYNPDAVMNDGSCEYAACDISFDVVPSETEDDVLIVTPSANISDAISVTWFFGDGNTSNEIYPFHQYEGDGPYDLCLYATFEIPDDANCTVSYCMEIDASMLGRSSGFAIQVEAPESLSARESTTDEGLRLWPNPAHDEVSVRYFSTSGQPASLSVFDLTGRLVVQESRPLNAGENTFVFRTDQLVPGVYIVQLRQEKEAVTARLVIAK